MACNGCSKAASRTVWAAGRNRQPAPHPVKNRVNFRVDCTGKGKRMASKHKGVWFQTRVRNGVEQTVICWREGGKKKEKWASAIPECHNPETGNVTRELVEKWAKKQAKKLQASEGREAGVPVALADAVKEYLAQDSLRPATKSAYTYALEHFKTWATHKGLVTCDKLTPGHLAQFRVHVTTLKKRVPQKGEGRGRGAREEGAEKLSPVSRNLILRGVATFVNHIRRLDYIPAIDRDSISDRLKRFDEEESEIEVLDKEAIAALLAAAARHDAETWDKTREEHAGEREAGTTLRYEPIRPFILACLLMGGRFQEVAGLRWDEVNLKAGEINLDPKRVKTKKSRKIRLSFSPLLWDMLRSMKLQAGDSKLVFNMTRDRAESARKRLTRKPSKRKSQRAVTDFGAPPFRWHSLRRTCATFLVNTPGVSLVKAARHLGHSVQMAESRYWSDESPVDPRAKNIEQAMGIVPIPAESNPTALQKGAV